jgi:hypothetical protein
MRFTVLFFLARRAQPASRNRLPPALRNLFVAFGAFEKADEPWVPNCPDITQGLGLK